MRTLLLALTLVSTVAAGDAISAEITSSILKDGKARVFLNGEIAIGDSDRLKGVIKSANDNHHIVSGIRLNSFGGNLSEGVKISDIVRYGRIATVVVNGGQCASACFIIFAAGAEKYANYNALIGVHGASDQSGKETLESGAATISMARIVKDLGVPSSIIGKMVVTPPEKIVWLTADDLKAMGVVMLGKPSQVPPENQAQAPMQIAPETRAAAPPAWDEFFKVALNTSSIQNGGRPNLTRSCQPEYKICRTGIWYSGKDSVAMLAISEEDFGGRVILREVCSFNQFKDVRLCLDWDTVKRHRDMKKNDGGWYKIGDE